MKIAVIPLMLLVAGCASQHSYYTADRPHIQRDQVIAESNRFPTSQNRDTYYWYQKNESRNTPTGGNPGADYHYGPTTPPGYYNYAPWPGYYRPGW